MPDEDVTLGELRRNIQDMRVDYERVVQETRQDTQKALNQMQRTIDKMAEGFERLPYVRQDIFEERMRNTGERQGKVEQETKDIRATLSKINFTAWTAIVFPIVVALATAAILVAVNLKA